MSFVPQTPMMRQYFDAKAAHPGALIAMRVGDFYEFYGDDAETAARALEITLTGKEDGANGRVAMAGVPFHAFDKYLTRLVALGHRVGICEQIDDPKTTKGLIRRQVRRVLTPGTLMEDSHLDQGEPSFLCGLAGHGEQWAIATLEPSTGEFLVTEVTGEGALRQELARLQPAEVIGAKALEGVTGFFEVEPVRADRAEQELLAHLGVHQLSGFGLEGEPLSVMAAALVLRYAKGNGLDLAHIETISTYQVDEFMRIDAFSRRTLELTQNLADGSRRHTLLDVLDRTRTGMGARLLRRWIDQPLLSRAEIESRHEAVRRLIENSLIREELGEKLKRVSDLERLVSRCSARLASPRDLANLRASLQVLPEVLKPLQQIALGRLQRVASSMGDHFELARQLYIAIQPEPPLTLRDGGVIADEYDAELDQLRRLGRDGRSFIAEMETAERAATGIQQLKVGYNSVFGYYIEVPKQHSERVPPAYIRKQTTANAERYITAELKEHESRVLDAGDKAIEVEHALFERLREQVAAEAPALLATARAIAELDVLCSLASVSIAHRYVRPELVDDNCLEIIDGRHPVVEAGTDNFVPNSVSLEPLAEGTRTIILTGPNMSGKSTFLRQNALICLMAQIGCYVPASSAKLSIHDQLFTRIGAKDELASGQSTFMVEMTECAYILNHATDRSLVVLDEVGRGTSTFDGMAIAWAIIERLVEIGAKTMFATHYHQLNILAEQLSGVANFRVAVAEVGDSIVWTHRVLPGGTDRSYGIHVARMAGVPPSVLDRAGHILADLESTEPRPAVSQVTQNRLQLSLFEAAESPVVTQLREIPLDSITPIQALQILDDLKRKIDS
ncbi:MAG: DNA mismatch repair protein MutS [Chthonomonas sp.]|nr:DNA mismatch repair protein MutS [Chthonomonas sp.]